MAYRWPTDPPGKPARHSKPWGAHQTAVKAQQAPRSGWQQASAPLRPARAMQRSLQTTQIGGKPVSYGQWQSGGLAKALLGPNWQAKAGVPGAPSPAPAAVPTPGPAAGPVPRPSPVDPIYDASLGRIASHRDQTLAELRDQRIQGLGDYGYTEGPGGALTVDPRNPFSKAALLKRNYDTSRRSTGQQMASTGGLYSGGYQNAQDLVNRGELGAQDSLQKALTRFLGSNTAAVRKTGQDYVTDAEVLGGERAARIQDNPLYEPSIEAPAAPAPGRAAPARLTPAQASAAQRRKAKAGSDAAAARARARAKAKRKKR